MSFVFLQESKGEKRQGDRKETFVPLQRQSDLPSTADIGVLCDMSCTEWRVTPQEIVRIYPNLRAFS